MGTDLKLVEAKNYIKHDLAPNLNHQVSGEFNVGLIGCDRQFAELELRIVDPKTKQVVYVFGRKTIIVGGQVTLEGLESNINFLPRDL